MIIFDTAYSVSCLTWYMMSVLVPRWSCWLVFSTARRTTGCIANILDSLTTPTLSASAALSVQQTTGKYNFQVINVMVFISTQTWNYLAKLYTNSFGLKMMHYANLVVKHTAVVVRLASSARRPRNEDWHHDHVKQVYM